MTITYKSVSPTARYSVSESIELEFLDRALDLFLEGKVQAGMNLLRDKLLNLYLTTSNREWADLLQNEILAHPVKNTILEDPLTNRSFYRPRGYAGDAETLDMIYFPKKANLQNASNFGKKLFHYTTHTQIAYAIRERINMLAKYIDGVAQSNPDCQVLSVACGHSREIGISRSFKNDSIGRFVGIDQDQASLDFAKTNFSNVNNSSFNKVEVSEIVKGSLDFGKFDLIYSAGLYDYLGNRTGQRLTSELYNNLLPNGKLVIFNVVPDYREIGYFESFLNWSLIGRDREAMLDLANKIPPNEMATCAVGSGKNNTFHFLEITKSP